MSDPASTPGKNGGSRERAPERPAGLGGGRTPRVISDPRDIARLVMIQIDAVNAKKDDLTTAVKTLADTAKHLVRAYAQQAAVIEGLAKKLKELEEKGGKK